MPEQQGTMTERLSNVIQIILLTQQTGTMTALRHRGNINERGSIRFIKGEIASANIGEHSGTETVKELQSWGKCHYWFSHQTAAEITAILQSEAEKERQPAPGGAPQTGQQAAASWQNEVQQIAFPTLVDKQKRPNTEPIQPVRSNPNAGKPVITEPMAPIQSAQIARHPLERHTPPITQRTPKSPGDALQKQVPAKNPEETATTIPHRMAHNGDVVIFMEQMGFSRLHKHVYLLINGRRTMQDLTQVTGRSPGEVQALIKDLMQLGLVEF